MDTFSTGFSDLVRERILDLVWRQWVAIGVPGYTRFEENEVVDPEALLVLTMTVGRHEIRLFDEVVAWLRGNGDLINVQRLRALLRRSTPEVTAAIAAIAEILGRKSTGAAKWKQLASAGGLGQPTPLFFQRDGRSMPTPAPCDDAFERHGLLRPPVPLDKKTGTVPRQGNAALLLRLRALLGVTLRCEVLCVLGAHDEIHPSRLARLTATAPRTIQKLLAEMERSGFVQLRAHAREKMYSLSPDVLDGLLRPGGRTPWRNSVPLFLAVERIWSDVVGAGTPELDPLVASSLWRRLSRDLRPLLADAGLPSVLRDDRPHRGDGYATVFRGDVAALMERL
jgi:hypothetical protein